LVQKLAFFLLCYSSLISNEGLFAHKSSEESLDVMAHFLPYNPTVLMLGATDDDYEKCQKTWPLGQIFLSAEECLKKKRRVDFLWMNEESPLKVFFSKNATVLFHKNCTSSPSNMSLCTRWEEGSFFLNHRVYEGFVMSIHFCPAEESPPIGSFRIPAVISYLKTIRDKTPIMSLPHIDYVYMINLDQRPEKFSASLDQLRPFGIVPYRFSAINGWDLPVQVLDELGVRLNAPVYPSVTMGKVYREIDGIEYKNIEFITDPNTTYFCTGITRGAIGCLLSHLSVLQDAYESGYQTIWVMEDDIQVQQLPCLLPSLIEELDQIDPDWDILFTDPDLKGPQGTPIPCRALAIRPDITMYPLSYYLEKFQPINTRLSKIGMRYGSHSMIFRRSGLRKILEYYKKHALFLPYDCDFWLVPSLRMYCPTQEIISGHHFITDNGTPTWKSS
jgi:hypothetical protein